MSWRCLAAAGMFVAIYGTGTLRAQTQPPAALPPGVHMRLEVKDGKTRFKMGEPIDLELTVSGDNQGYEVGAWEGDHVNLTPEDGVFRWQGLFSSDAIATTPLTAQGNTFTTRLNDQYEIKQPGTYTASVNTWRVMKKGPTQMHMPQSMQIVSNTVTFELRPMSDEDEAARVKLLTPEIEAAATPETAKKAWDELAYLTGDAAAREKVRMVLAARNGKLAKFPHPDEDASRIGDDVQKALALSQNKKLEIDLLDAGWQDVHAVPDRDLLGYMTALARLDAGIGIPDSCGMCATPRTKWDDKQALEKPYLDEIAATMPQRTGQNLADTAEFLFGILQTQRGTQETAFAQVRKIVIDSFESFPLDDRSSLLKGEWAGSTGLKDAALVPALVRMQTERVAAESDAAQDEPAVSNMAKMQLQWDREDAQEARWIALERLIDLDPETALPFVVAELKKPDSEVELDTVGGLEEKAVPELDKPLLEQIQALAVAGAKLEASVPKAERTAWLEKVNLLDRKAWLVARYASPAIWEPMLAVYRSLPPSQQSWYDGWRDALLVYLLRWRPAEAMPLLLASGQSDLFARVEKAGAPTLSRIYTLIGDPYPPEVRTYLRDQVEHGSAGHAGEAAVQLALHGVPGDQAVLTKRLAALEAEWHAKPEQLENQGTVWPESTAAVEQRLIEALSIDAVWHPTTDELVDLKAACVGKFCAQLRTEVLRPEQAY